tara:strand:- start:1007 stop:1171 length:165 start_codon:yes stop_codon:yes gene_type:complete
MMPTHFDAYFYQLEYFEYLTFSGIWLALFSSFTKALQGMRKGHLVSFILENKLV